MANITRQIEALQELIDAPPASGSEAESWRQRAVAILSEIGRQQDAVHFEGIKFCSTPRMLDPADPAGNERRAAEAAASALAYGVAEGKARLNGALAALKLRQDASGEVRVGELHEWLADKAGIIESNPTDAVSGACSAIESKLRTKLGIQGTGVDLISKAFSKDPPAAGQPRLRFTNYAVGTQAWTNAHEGTADFGRGCFKRIRNLVQHGEEVTPSEAVEVLSALSLLARWLDEADLDTI